MPGFSGDRTYHRFPQPLAEALQRVPAVLVQHPDTAVLQLGKVYLNLPKLLGNCQLTEPQLQRLLRLVLRKDITHSQLVNNFQDEQQQPDQQQSASAAIPAANQQPDTVEAAAASAEQPGMLPWHTLILNQQPLGIEGLAQLFQQLIPTLKSPDTQRLRSLAASDCNISGSLSDLVLQPLLAAHHHCCPEWVSHLQWLDLSHNPQLLGPENWKPQAEVLGVFLRAARELQGLCLQYTGLTSIQLQNLLTAMDRLPKDSQIRSWAFRDSGRRPLCNLQCLKLGPISPDPDNSAAAGTTSSSSSHQTSGWPAAAFEDMYQRLANSVPPFNRLLVLELYGLSQQQQQNIADWADHVSELLSSQPSWKADVMINPLAQDQPHVAQPHPDCCRISWLKPGQPLEFETPVPGFDWILPPPQPVQSATPVAAEPGVDAGAHTAAMPFAMPAVAAWPLAAGTGWTFPPPPPPPAAGGGGGGAAGAGAGSFRPRQPQQPATARASAAAVGTKSVLDVLGRPSGFVHDTGRQHRTTVSLAAAAAAAAAAAGDVPRAAQQHTFKRQQQPRQHRDIQQQRVGRHTAWQLGITDFADQLAYDAAAMDEDWQERHEQQQQHDIHAVAAYSNVDDDFMDSGNSRQRQRRHRPSPSLAAAAAAAAASDDQGIVLGSQDTYSAATDGSPRVRDGGILAGLIKQHRDDICSESDNDDQMFVFAALKTNGQDDEVLRTGAGREVCRQQQPTRRKRKKRTLQPIQFDAYASSPAAAAGYGVHGSSPAHRLSPLESPLSGTGLEHSPPDSWQQQQDSMDSLAATGRSTEDEDDAAPDRFDPDLDAALDKFLAEEDDDNRHGVYSQDEASQDRGSQGQGDGILQQRQQQRDDDDPEELRAFYFEKTKLQGQGLGPKGQQLFGLANEGEKRRHKTAIGDKAQQTLQQLRSRYEQQQPPGDQAVGQTQPLLGQPRRVGISSGGTLQGVKSREAKKTGARKLGNNHRRSRGGGSRFVDDAAGGGGAYGYEEELLTGSSSSSSEDGRGSDPPARQRRMAKSETAGHGAAAADQVIQDYDGATAADEGDEPLVPTAAAAVRGSSRHRSRVAVLDSEPQDEPDPLDAMLQQHYEQQQQQRCQETGEVDYAACGGGSSRKSRIAVLDSEPQDEPDLPDAMMQQHYEQQQQQIEQLNPAPADRSKGDNLASKAVQQSVSKKHTTRGAATCSSRRQQRSANSRLPGALLTAQTAAATAGPHQPVCRQPHGNAESSPQPVDDEDPDHPGDLSSIPEYQQWKEAEAELKRLQEAERQLLQEIQAAQATAAAAAAATPEAVPPVPPAATLTVGDTAVDEQTAPTAGLLTDNEVGAAADETATDNAAVAVAVEDVGDRVNSLQQQLKSITNDRKRQQRMVKFLKGNVPWHWDKRGPEACSFQINKLQDSKRQSRAPTRLSPGAIEQQERLMRLAQQQQQQREAVPVQSAAAERTVTLPAKKVGNCTRSAPASTHRDLEIDSESASSGCSSSSWSDSQDDMPLATLYQQRPHSSTPAASPAGDTMEPKGCCPGDADGNGAPSSDANDRLSAQQHQQQSGGEPEGQHVPAVARDPSTLAAVVAAAARDRQAMQPPTCTAAAVTAAGGDGDGGRRRTSRMTAGKASKEFSKLFGSDYYTASMPLPAAATGAATGSSSAAAAAKSGRADAFDSVNATGVEPAAVAKLACPLLVPAAIVSQQKHQQQQHQDCVTTVPVTAAAGAAAAACATTAAAVAQHTSSQPGHDVVVDRLHKAQESSASGLQLASAQVQPGQQLQQQQPQDNAAQHSSQQQQQQRQDIISQNSSQQQQPQQPQDLLPQQCSQQQQQENTVQQHQLVPESSAACTGQGVSGMTDVLQGPTAQAQERQAPGRHHIAPHAPESAATAVELRDPGQSAAAAPSLASDAAPTAAVCEGAAVIQQAQPVVEAAAAVRTEQTVVRRPPVPHAAVEVAVGSVAASPGASLVEEPPELEIPDSEEDEC